MFQGLCPTGLLPLSFMQHRKQWERSFEKHFTSSFRAFKVLRTSCKEGNIWVTNTEAIKLDHACIPADPESQGWLDAGAGLFVQLHQDLCPQIGLKLRNWKDWFGTAKICRDAEPLSLQSGVFRLLIQRTDRSCPGVVNIHWFSWALMTGKLLQACSVPLDTIRWPSKLSNTIIENQPQPLRGGTPSLMLPLNPDL